MKLSHMFRELEMAVPYHPALARNLGLDPTACIFFAQLWYVSGRRADESGWFSASLLEVGDSLSMSPKVQRRARERLLDLGLLEVRRGATMQYRVNVSLLEARLGRAQGSLSGSTKCPSGTYKVPIGNLVSSSYKKEEEREEGLLFEDSITFEDILNGHIDTAPTAKLLKCPEHIMKPLLSRWSVIWGLDGARVRMTVKRRQAWRQALREGAAPSDFAKAIEGMRHDDWADRADYCDWPHVTKGLRRWCRLYDKQGSAPKPDAAGLPFKVVKGVRVPPAYVWDAQDDHLHSQGFRFDLINERWVP